MVAILEAFQWMMSLERGSSLSMNVLMPDDQRLLILSTSIPGHLIHVWTCLVVTPPTATRLACGSAMGQAVRNGSSQMITRSKWLTIQASAWTYQVVITALELTFGSGTATTERVDS